MNKHQRASEGMQGLKNVRQQLHSRRAYLQKQIYNKRKEQGYGLDFWLGEAEGYKVALNIVNKQIGALKLVEKYRRKVKQ